MRMQLTDEEAKLILRKREVDDAHRAGWNKALDAVYAMVEREMRPGSDTGVYSDLLAPIEKMKRGEER